MTKQFIRFMQIARTKLEEKFTAVYGMMFDPEGLRESFESLAGNKAPGIDGERKTDYKENVDERLSDLSARIRRMGYIPKPARRVYIPKLSGGSRPLGIPSFEDRIVQDRAARILNEIWEPEFRGCSYGFRPGRSAHDALREVDRIIVRERTQYLVEADIKGFFNNVSHEHLMPFISHRVVDPNFKRLIHRFLKAGVMEDGAFSATEMGTPQGGLVSPVLANIYLHYVLDLWFEKRFARKCRGKAYLVRYADDFIACFENKEDAESYLEELSERLKAFDLETEPSKTKLIAFGSKAQEKATFNFLGFTHYTSKTRKGKFKIARKTEGKRMRTKLKQLKIELRKRCNAGGGAIIDYARRHLTGHIQYYGVSENSRHLATYVHWAQRLLFKVLNQRSQKRSYTWERFGTLIAPLLPRPRIVHSFYAS